MDATIVASSRTRPAPQEAANGTAPDADASYTRNHHRFFYGYKAHLSTDGEHNLIRRAITTTAGRQDAHLLPEVTPPDAGTVYADKAYDTLANKPWLQDHGLTNGILKKGAYTIHLSDQDHEDNRHKNCIRKHIERVFGHFKLWLGYRRVRYLGLAKNQLELTLKAPAYNLTRLANIIA